MSKRKKRPSQPQGGVVTKARDTATTANKARDEKALDSYTNPLAKLGLDQPNTSEAAGYVMTRRTQDYNLMNTLYRDNWIARRLIDVVPEDMMKNGYKITSQIKPEAIAKLEKLERKVQLRKRILSGLKWGRLYGGAIGVIIIAGQEDMLSEPLDYDAIMPGSFKGIVILDRWSGVQAGSEIVSDINDPDFGLPAYYDTYGKTSAVRVHHSRVVRFTGRDLPFIEEQMEMYWGASELEHVFDEIKKRDNTSWNIAQLVFMANLRVLKIEGMENITATMNTNALKALQNTIEAQNQMMNNNSLQIIGKEDDFATHQYTFAGLSDVYESFMMDIAGAAEIPVTKLFGRSPAGMNATGESDMQNYYDSIEEKQEAYLRPVYDRLLPIMCMSEFGAVPDDLDYEFKPIRRLSDEQRVDLTSKHTSAIIEAYNVGLISQQIALKELQQMKETTGTWSNITDEDIERADADFGLGGELDGLTGMLPDFKQPSLQKAMDEWHEEDHPRRKDGKFGEGGESSKSSKPKHLETIDFKDKKMVQSTLEKYEEQIVNQDYESSIVILPNGKVMRIDGDGATVNLSVMDKLEGAIMTHNHPAGKGFHTFGIEDFNLFYSENISVLRGVEEDYTYELSRNKGVAPELPQMTVFEMTEENVEHYRMDARSRKEGFYYERKQRNNGKGRG